jgi:2-polyprenyl-3-methyl-5-hydroxy-6-metoxy-1,4-benzoquinol methylase
MSKAGLIAHPKYGFLQVTPTPSPEEISEYYAQEFYSGDYQQLNDSSLEVQVRDQEFYDAQRESVLRDVEAVSGRPVAGRSMLDVGCGWGQALLFFQKHGFDCAGFDPAPEAVDYARSRGLNVVHAGIERLDVFAPRRFDVVTLFNVLEHLADPVGIVSQIRDLVLVPGGLLVIDVPNEFNDFQLSGQAVHGLREWWVAPPAHLNYFSGSTLRALLVGEGFEVPIIRASFPMELFLLFGQNYVNSPELGRACHEQRMAFEANLRATGRQDLLDELYTWLASRNLGRQVVAVARIPPT